MVKRDNGVMLNSVQSVHFFASMLGPSHLCLQSMTLSTGKLHFATLRVPRHNLSLVYELSAALL